jgi:hypothetical protein
MSVGLLFGGFWAGLGVLMWWWPAAVFVAFSNEDVTPGARGFAVGAIYIGLFFLTLDVPALGIGFALPGTVLVVGVLMLAKPIRVPYVHRYGWGTPSRLGIGLVASGVVLAILTVL